MPAGAAHLACRRMCLACSRCHAPLLSILSPESSRQRCVVISRQIWRSGGALETKARVMSQLRQCKDARKWVCAYGTLQTSCLLALWPEMLIWCRSNISAATLCSKGEEGRSFLRPQNEPVPGLPVSGVGGRGRASIARQSNVRLYGQKRWCFAAAGSFEQKSLLLGLQEIGCS